MGSLSKCPVSWLQHGVGPCSSNQMHPKQAAPCQGGQVPSALSLPWLLLQGYMGSSLFLEGCSDFGKRACIHPVYPPSTSPRPGNFLSSHHGASCLCCTFLFMEYATTASFRGSHILPVSCIIFPCCIDKDKSSQRIIQSARTAWSPGSRLECLASCSSSGCSWGDKDSILMT